MDKLKIWISNNKSGIVLGGVTGIFATILLNLISSIISFFPYASSNIIKSLIDYEYFLTSTMSNTKMLSILICLIYGIMFGVIVVTAISGFFIAKFDKKMESLDENTEDISDFTKKIQQKLRKSIKKAMILGLICFLILIFMITSNFISINIKQKFELEMIEIKPYIDIKSYDELNSKWVQMKTKNDYVSIDKKIDEIQKKNSLKEIRLIDLIFN